MGILSISSIKAEMCQHCYGVGLTSTLLEINRKFGKISEKTYKKKPEKHALLYTANALG